MAISPCNPATDASGRELASHGSTAFPIACYHDDFRKMDVPWHWHQELEAVIITAGSCVVAAGQEKYTLHAGEGFFINSGILHGMWDTQSTGCEFHSLVFHPRLVGGSLDSVFHQSYIQPLLDAAALEILPLSPEVPWQKRALEAIEAAWQQCSLEPSGFAFRVRSHLSELIYQIHAHMPLLHSRTGSKALRDGERIKSMLSFIHDHYGSDLDTQKIAASAMVSQSECLRCFRSTIGTSPIRYLKQFRIQQAAQLLISSADSVTDIACHCGFQDMSYFSKSFRELKGCTPSEYRAAHAEKTSP